MSDTRKVFDAFASPDERAEDAPIVKLGDLEVPLLTDIRASTEKRLRELGERFNSFSDDSTANDAARALGDLLEAAAQDGHGQGVSDAIVDAWESDQLTLAAMEGLARFIYDHLHGDTDPEG